MTSLLVAVVLTVAVVTDRSAPVFQDVDDGWRALVMSGRTGPASDPATAIATFLDTAGSWPLAYLLVAAVVVIAALARRWLAALYVASVVALTSLAAIPLLKLLVERARPPGHLVHAAGYSFPSGHAGFAAIAGASMVLALTTRRRRWMPVAVGFVLAMMWSRTYLSVHWLSDTVAGALLGFAVALIGWWAMPARARPAGQAAAPGRAAANSS